MVSASVELARRMWDVLIEIAARRDRISYSGLGGIVGHPARYMTAPLTVIHNHCLTYGVPELNALVVNARTRVPGAGFSTDLSEFEDLLKRIYRTDWTKIPRP